MGSTQCVNISITDNLAFEKNETFFVIISSEPEVTLPDPNVTVVIADDEGQFYMAISTSLLSNFFSSFSTNRDV